MLWLKKALRNWFQGGDVATPRLGPIEETRPATMRININKALGGHIVSYEVYQPNPRGPDWTGETMIVPEGQDLMDAIKALIAIKGVST